MIRCIKKENKKKETCLIGLTNGSIRYGNLSLAGDTLSMFPDGIVGPTNLSDGCGKEIELFLDGLNETIITDVPADKKIFRRKPRIREFIRHHKLKVNDKVILERKGNTRFVLRPANAPFTFIDLFAGIGGFRIAMQEEGGKCVFSSEWDPYARQTYEANFGEVPEGDIREIAEENIPDHDILCAGFPCQPFSLAGVSSRNSLNTAHGFACKTQGTLFFDIIRILEAKKPKVVFLENVRNLIGHDGGKTFSVIKNAIESIGYSFSYKLINASPLVPQKRVRCYMVCIRDDDKGFNFPLIDGPPLPLKSILEDTVDDSFTISSKLWEGHQRRTKRNLARGTGFTAFCADLDKPSNTIVARYGKDGKECLIPQGRKNPRMLTPRECARLQGFPETFIFPKAKTAAYRLFGNSVAIPVVRRIAENIVKLLRDQK